jgi:hypothetical protein
MYTCQFELGLLASERRDAALNVLAQSHDWERVVTPTMKLMPVQCYVDNYKKRMESESWTSSLLFSIPT